MGQSLTDSQIAMWKTVVALIYADGERHPAEEEFLKERFAKLSATDEQKRDLLSSLENPGQTSDHFQGITEPGDRSQLIYFARLFFFSDGDFSEQEKQVLAALEGNVMSRVDLSSAIAQSNKEVDRFAQWEQEQKDKQPIHRKILNALVFWTDLDSVDG